MESYFESSWAILSSICLINVLFGLLVINLTSVSPASLVPVVTSCAGAIANGCCYYAYYTDYPVINRATASIISDLMWMVQETGITFYSYVILRRILRGPSRHVFEVLFWILVAIITLLRISIAVYRGRFVLNPDLDLQNIINKLHVGYFTGLAIVECISAAFLLREFASGKKSSQQASLGGSLFSHLIRSTEIRVATLALIGTTRAVTYYFQPQVQRASSPAAQVDRFVYTLESLFPIMLFIDMLASRMVHRNGVSQHSFPQFRHKRASVQHEHIETHIPTNNNEIRPFDTNSITRPGTARLLSHGYDNESGKLRSHQEYQEIC